MATIDRGDNHNVKIYFYYKLDRGYYESAYATWKREGGQFATHLLRTNHAFYAWVGEFERLNCNVTFDPRSSFLLPQTVRYHLPLSLAQLLRGALWVTKFDPWLLQRDLIRRIETLKPDVAFFYLGSSVWESTLRELKRRGVKLVQMCDLPATTMLARDRVNLPYFDLIFVPANLDAGLRAAGARGRMEYVPLGFAPEVHRPLQLTPDEHQQYQSDVCFIGALDKQFHSQRRQWVEYAIEQGVHLKIWGGYRHQYLDSPILRHWHGQIWGEAQVKALCAAKIGLNFHVDHQPGELDRGLNIRAFELAACGVFQLLQRVPGVTEFFEEGKEIVCFDSREEMIDKIRYYLAHDEERQRIAAAAHARALREHTWAQRIERMVMLMREFCQ